MIFRLRKLWHVVLRALTGLGVYLRNHWRAALIIAIVGVVVLALVGWAAYLHWGLGWGWIEWAGEVGPGGKTWWDWLELLVIPIVLALGAFGLQRSERDSDRKLAEQRRQDDQEKTKDQQRETALQAYFDKMTELFLDEKHPLRTSSPGDEVQVVARTRTLATLRGFDPLRKGMLLQFLYEAKLITPVRSSVNFEGEERDGVDLPVIELAGADLSKADLHGANLQEADLRGADLRGANLSRVNLSWVNLYKADLSGAELYEAELGRANLSGADLSEANLRGAFLSRTNLHGANLSGAILHGANLSGAILHGANLSGADLCRVNLRGADLYEADLCGTDLRGTDLRGAILSGAILREVDLHETNLHGAILREADLFGADLRGADLSRADLSRVDLNGTNLSGAKVTDDQLCMAKTLDNAIMPDGRKYNPYIHTFKKVLTASPKTHEKNEGEQ